jgi:type I restriction enzyme S subunit
MREMKDSGIAWIGAMPRAWKMNTIAQISLQVKCKNTGLQEKNLLSLSYGKVKRKSIDTVEGLLPESFDGYNIIEKDDIVLRLTDLQNDHTSLRVGLAEERGIITSAYLTIRNRSNFCPKYLYYYLHSFDIAKGFYGMGAGVRQGLNWDGVKLLKILAPSVPEQERIAAFLDAECAEIDAVLEKTRASIEEYKKLKQAVITQAVTKGIRGDRPMKNSGIEWIGEIPAEWDVIRNAFLYKEKSRLPEENAVSLSLSQVDGLIATDDMKERSLKTSTYDGWKQVRTNDLVLNRFKGHLGVLFAANIEGMVSFHYGVYEPLRQFDSKFFEYLYHSDAYKAILGLKSNGMTIGLQNLSNQNFYSVYSLYPPEEEQQEIIQYLDDKCSGIDALIVQKQEHFTEIENYKKSLIYEYVTGKKEVKTSVLAD